MNAKGALFGKKELNVNTRESETLKICMDQVLPRSSLRSLEHISRICVSEFLDSNLNMQ